MGVLYAKVGGQFVQIAQTGPPGPAGGPVPVGGAVGDLIIKSGAADFAVRWGYDPPKLSIPNPADPSVTSTPATGDPFVVGTIASSNIALYRGGIMARNNGAVNILRLNYYGGTVVIGGGDNSQFPVALQLGEGAATSRRAFMKLGTGWEVGQDYAGTGVKDFYLFDAAYGGPAFRISADGLTTTVAGDVSWRGGAGVLTLSGVEATIKAVGSATTLTFLADKFNFLNKAGSAWTLQWDGTRWWIPGKLQLDGTLNGFTLSTGVIGNRLVCSSPEGYIVGNYINMTADTGGDAPVLAGRNSGDNYMRWYNTLNANKINWGATGGLIQGTKISGNSYADGTIWANPGSTMAAYSLHPGGVAGLFRMQMNSATYHCNNTDGSGYYNIVASAFTPGSSERFKQEITPLVRSLPAMPVNPVATMVRSLRPVWYRQREPITMTEIPPRPPDLAPGESWAPPIEDAYIHYCRDEGPGNCGHTPDDPCSWRVNWMRGQLGFVAEEVERVLPALVQLGTDMQPVTIDLGSFVALAYAMLHELDSRIEQLERTAA